MYLNTFSIGHLKPKFPIIQGGMGIGISLNKLASAVANSGGIGVLSAAQIGFKEPDFIKNPFLANMRALEKEIKLARLNSPQGILGVNLMVAMKNYKDYVKQAVACKIDLILSGAGLPIDLPLYAGETSTQLVPIVSSARAAALICRVWDKRYHRLPDAIVVEGPLAGGHLGFDLETLANPPALLTLVKEVRTAVESFTLKYNKPIPVIAAGGIFSAQDVKEALDAGADAVQMATRFVTTVECDAPLAYKEAYLQATEEAIAIVKSPVGMPGRAILNDFVTNSPGNNRCLYHCLEKCDVHRIPYCISSALIGAATGDMNHALLFCGSNAYKCQSIETVGSIFEDMGHVLV